mmetsp:Transcript_99571/g.286022  ORF Transcript_99571/g.286022 Transcript_99571/m.286022 type:complete len:89 (+) Transcript_99571:760-1026(+)
MLGWSEAPDSPKSLTLGVRQPKPIVLNKKQVACTPQWLLFEARPCSATIRGWLCGSTPGLGSGGSHHALMLMGGSPFGPGREGKNTSL